jgi:Bacterial TniB protein
MTHSNQLNKLMSLGLDQTELSKSTESLKNFTLRKEIVEHSIFTKAIREIARLHDRGRTAHVAEGLLLVAQTGSGKTTALEFYEHRFPRSTSSNGVQIPVLRVDTPESPTVKSFAEAILYALKDPGAARGTATEKTNRIIHFFKECFVELLLIDEFQHFFDGKWNAESRRVSDWLKNLINKVNIPVVLAGLPRSISVVNSNPQLRRRFGAPHYMKPFGFDTASEQKEFRALLKGIQEVLPLQSINLYDVNNARRFYFATHGLFDYVVKIIDDAVSRRSDRQKEPLTLKDFAEAFKRTVWLNAPDLLNPFSEKPTLRLLNKPLEPFDIWDAISKYTSHTNPK